MEKMYLSLKNGHPKVFFVLLFQLMVSLVGFAQSDEINTTSKLANPFVGQDLNFINPLLLNLHHVGGLIVCDKAGPLESMQGWYSNHRAKGVTTTLPANV